MLLTDQGLDDVYTRACYAIAKPGEAKEPLFLPRLALLLRVSRALRVNGTSGRRLRCPSASTRIFSQGAIRRLQ